MPIAGIGPCAVTPVMRTAYVDQSTQPLIASLLTNPDARRYYLLKVSPYDPDGAAVVDRYYGAGLSRVPASDALWKPYLIDAFNVSVELFNGPFGRGGEGRPSFGAIKIAIGEEAERHYMLRDEFSWLAWNQRAITLYMGGDPAEGWTFDDYVTVFSGLAEEATWDEDHFVLVVRDPSVRLDQPIQSEFYEGTGALEGGEDLKGKPKPMAFGKPRNITPVLVDRAALIYQVHSRNILAIDAVYDKGVAYTNAGASSNLYLDTIAAGTFKHQLAFGRFRLGTTPNGIVTADVQGDVTGSTNLNDKQGQMIKRILKSRAGFVDAEIDLGALVKLDTSGHEASVYLTTPTTISSVIDGILLPNGYRTFDSTGRFTAGKVEIGVPVLTLEPPRVVSIFRDRTRLPSWRVSLGYARNWTLLRETDLAVIGLGMTADFATNEYRRVVVEDASVKTRIPGAFDDTIDTLWNFVADAQSEVDALHELTKEDRDLYRVTASRIQFRLRAGQTVRLKHERFGLRDGRDFVVLGISENTSSGLTQLALWG